jgi:hypothetical protein
VNRETRETRETRGTRGTRKNIVKTRNYSSRTPSGNASLSNFELQELVADYRQANLELTYPDAMQHRQSAGHILVPIHPSDRRNNTRTDEAAYNYSIADKVPQFGLIAFFE